MQPEFTQIRLVAHLPNSFITVIDRCFEHQNKKCKILAWGWENDTRMLHAMLFWLCATDIIEVCFYPFIYLVWHSVKKTRFEFADSHSVALICSQSLHQCLVQNGYSCIDQLGGLSRQRLIDMGISNAEMRASLLTAAQLLGNDGVLHSTGIATTHSRCSHRNRRDIFTCCNKIEIFFRKKYFWGLNEKVTMT